MAVISAMVVLSMIDARTMEIPVGINIFIFVIAVINFAFSFAGNYINKIPLHIFLPAIWMAGGYPIFRICFSFQYSFAGIFYHKGRGMEERYKVNGGSRTFPGLEINNICFVVAMSVCLHYPYCKDENHESIACASVMGPYLSAGILSAMWFGKKTVDLYLNFVPWKVIKLNLNETLFH